MSSLALQSPLSVLGDEEGPQEHRREGQAAGRKGLWEGQATRSWLLSSGYESKADGRLSWEELESEPRGKVGFQELSRGLKGYGGGGAKGGVRWGIQARSPNTGAGGLLPAGPASCSNRSISGGPSMPWSPLTRVCTPLLAPGPESLQGHCSTDRLCSWGWSLCSETRLLLKRLEGRMPSRFHSLTGTAI